MKIVPKGGFARNERWKRGYTPKGQPNYFHFNSERAGYLKEMPASERQRRVPAVGTVGWVNPAGAKLLKGFNRSGLRAKHATAVQRPCYGRRSERAKV